MGFHHAVISGCSGGGKSTLLAELQRRGHDVLAEPGRRIVEHELLVGGRALPWLDAEAFARRAISMAMDDLEAFSQRRDRLANWLDTPGPAP